MRDDVHSPKSFNPADYEFEDAIYQGSSTEFNPQWLRYERERINALRERMKAQGGNGFKGNWLNEHRCDHCGAHFSYGCVYVHAPSMDLIVVGQDCANNAFGFNSRRDYEIERLRSKAAAARKRGKKIKLAAVFMDATPGLREALDLQEHHTILKDMNEKLYAYGKLSEKQVAFALKLAEEVRNPPPPKPEEPKVEVVAGRRELTGVVLGFKEVDTQFGLTLKMIFRTDDGQKIYGTVPAELRRAGIEKGDKACFKATVEVSQDDKCFGFFSRPSGGSVEKANSAT